MTTTGRLRTKVIFIFGLSLFSCLANGEFDTQNGCKSTDTECVSGRRLLGKDDDKKGAKEEPAKAAPGGAATPAGGATPAAGGAAPAGGAGPAVGADGVLDITKYGAVADGKTDSSAAIMKAWQAACALPAATISVPKGSFMTKPLVFEGPCKNTKPIVLDLQGTLVATTEISAFTEDTWILFTRVENIAISGPGTFDGTGASAWKLNDCKTNKNCARLPSSVKFQRVTNGAVSGVTSLNAKYFHFHVTDSTGIKFDGIKIVAPAESPNTDGIHFSDSSGITVTNANIGTGDDCISVGPGVTDATYTGITCGPGHGLSVGSIGKNPGEKPVKGITFTKCTINGADNGARIKSFGDSPPGTASGITFQDITMTNVENPIIIDQNYGNKGVSKTVITDVHFKGIKGTSKSPVSILLDCSSANPCGVELSDINLTGTATCTNAKVTTTGTSTPACSGAAAGGAAPAAGDKAAAGATPAAGDKAAEPAKGDKGGKPK